MLAGYDDSIRQSIFSILVPSSGVYINGDMTRNLSATIGQITEEMAKTMADQQKSPHFSAWVVFDNHVNTRLYAGQT